MSMNQVCLMGRLVRDPEIHQVGKDAAVCNFTIAVDRNFTNADGDRDADFVGAVAWRGTAEFLSKWFHKGDPLALTGRIQTRSYEDDDGNTHCITEVVADQLFFCGSRKTVEGKTEEKTEEAPAKRDKYGYKKTSRK